MKRSRKYVRRDVHRATTGITMRDEAEHVVARTVVATERAGLRDVFRGMRCEVHVVLNEGTQAQWLHDLLVPLVHQVVAFNRRGAPPQGNKADHSDADEWSELRFRAYE